MAFDPNLIFSTVIVFHRIGVLVLACTSGAAWYLPYVLTEDDDKDFGISISKALQNISRVALIDLMISGLIRLWFGPPRFIIPKLIFASITISLFFFTEASFDKPEYQRLCLIRLISVLCTATLGFTILLGEFNYI